MPQDIVSDRDAKFTSKAWEDFCETLNIHQSMSTVYHPQTDGQSEVAKKLSYNRLRKWFTKETPIGLDNSGTFTQDWTGFEAHHAMLHPTWSPLDTLQDWWGTCWSRYPPREKHQRHAYPGSTRHKKLLESVYKMLRFLKRYNQTNADDQHQNSMLETKYFYPPRTCHWQRPTARSHQSGWDHSW